VPRTDRSWIQAGPRPLLIGGKWRAGEGGRSFPVVSAYTNETLTTISEASAGDIDLAVRAARKAFDEGPWPRMTPNQRAEVLARIARLFERERDRFA